MNIIIPLGGKGERFKNSNYGNLPKPLIKIFDKTMIEYVIDNLNMNKEDKLFIIYNQKLDQYNFSTILKQKYSNIILISIQDTKGAVETIHEGLKIIFSKYDYNKKTILLDCDTFYTEDILTIFRKDDSNTVFYTINIDKNPIYSYITLNESNCITEIKEKQKISDMANTGAYAFQDIHTLFRYCKHVLESNITFNNEPYTSCVISEMIKEHVIKGCELNSKYVFSLGTPNDVNNYINNTYIFLFDLDGTIVITDDIYYNAWIKILQKYNIELTKEMFADVIQGNSDSHVLSRLFPCINIPVEEVSNQKDDLFLENINKILLVEGVKDILEDIKKNGHKISIVTNCNKKTAQGIVDFININHLIDYIISSNDVIQGKPYPEPYFKALNMYNVNSDKSIIFEDSKTGLLSAKTVNPKFLIGLETIYNRDELLKYGVNTSISNFLEINLQDLLKFDNNTSSNIVRLLAKNLDCLEEQIKIDSKKLKGGFISDVLNFEVNSSNYVVKLENENSNNLSDMAKNLQLYSREYYFYKNVSKFVNIKIPKFLSLLTDDNSNEIGVILENLNKPNLKLNLNLNKENINISLKIIDNMAKMHAKFWNKNVDKLFPRLKRTNDKIFKPFLQEFIIKKIDIFVNKWSPLLTKNQVNLCYNIAENFNKIQEKLANDNLTLVHGDIKSPNIFYDIANDYEPIFLDWQHCLCGKGTQDLIFFIIESFDISQLDIVYNLFTSYYYKKIQEYNVSNYSYTEFNKDLLYSLYNVPFFTSIWFGSTPSDELIDKNFPYFFITKTFYMIEKLSKSNAFP